jgi:hypothetical protein
MAFSAVILVGLPHRARSLTRSNHILKGLVNGYTLASTCGE